MFEISAKKGLCYVICGSEVKTSNLAAHFHTILALKIRFCLLHLFAIGGGQSPKLIQYRNKTRHLTQQLVQRDWPMCVTVRRNLVSVRHSA